MCCFNYPVSEVQRTRIFVGARDGKQLTVYAAAVAGERIEMVLPVRTRGAAEIEWVDLKAYPHFFEDCEKAVQRQRARSTNATGIAPPAAAEQSFLPVEQVGDYKVSFAPGARDLVRADPRVFQLSDRLREVVEAHYPESEYGFVIYKPERGGEMHPLAYRHRIPEDHRLFVPTRHEHGDDGPPDWDHAIYHQGGAEHIPADGRSAGELPCGEVFERLKLSGLPVPAEVDFRRPMRKLERRGAAFPNGDLEIAPTVTVGMSAAAAAGALAVGGAVAAYHLLRERAKEN